ncbi:MAG: extracellular solute-binding protein [Firmicutes bacterium]|nr:extracellular solute-binding protein [Bacillota bacterium]
MKTSGKTWIVVLLLTTLILSGCGKEKTALNPRKPITITLWHYYVGDVLVALEEAVNTFNQTVGREKGVVVHPIAMGGLAQLERRTTDAATGTINSEPMPDAFSCYPDKAMEIDSYGKLIDLNDYLTEEEKTKYVQAFFQDGYSHDNRLLVLPIAKSTELLYVNNTAWQELCTAKGLTAENLATWEGLYETARQYYQWIDDTTPDTQWDGKGMMGLDSVANYIIIGNRQLGVEILHTSGTGEGKVILNQEVLSRVFEVYYKGYSMGYFDAVGKFRSDDIKSNDLIAYVGSSSGASYFPTWVACGYDKVDIDLLPVPYPVFQGGHEYAILQGAGMCVSKTDDAHQEGAALFLRWFTKEENNTPFAMASNYMPVQQGAYSAKESLLALDTLDAGDKSQRNAANAYRVALGQVVEGDVYAAPSFPGSYDARIILQKTLIQAAQRGRAVAKNLQQQNKSEEEVLQGIDTPAAFAEWLAALEEAFNHLGIPFERTKPE